MSGLLGGRPKYAAKETTFLKNMECKTLSCKSNKEMTMSGQTSRRGGLMDVSLISLYNLMMIKAKVVTNATRISCDNCLQLSCVEKFSS